ncbi:MAG: SUMF1/EgtB/PvdO family nonheme iron enzyme [Anaerolineae bacterium]|nr:SUMF1/EgtB/PvdO family nonheme iron enzyme [Anaerolineae bacterium]
MQRYVVLFLTFALAFAGAASAFGQTDEPAPILAGGGIFLMGTTPEEVEAALALCAPEDGCDAARADDSMPAHEVLLDPYQIDVLEVSNARYAEFLNALGPDSHLDGCLGQPCILTQEEDAASHITFDGTTYAPAPDAGNLPVTHVSWYGAQAFCEVQGGRLPSEAEWELAVRGGGGAIYPWGQEFDPNRANTAATGVGAVTPVDDYPGGLSGYGALNMIGNVAEWTSDWYAADYYGSAAAGNNPTGPETGDARVVRGGSWQDAPFYARAPQRASAPPGSMLSTIGFRCAKTGWPPPEAPAEEILTRYKGLELGVLEDGAPYLGSLDAPVVLAEFFQFTCPHCNNFRETLHQLWPYIQEGKLRVEARPLVNNSPLTLGPTFATLCAEKQTPGGYWMLHEYLFDGVHTEGSFALVWRRVLQRAEILGLDTEALETCVNGDTSVSDALRSTLELANQMSVTSVPTILIDGEYVMRDGQAIHGGVPLEILQAEIEAKQGQE